MQKLYCLSLTVAVVALCAPVAAKADEAGPARAWVRAVGRRLDQTLAEAPAVVRKSGVVYLALDVTADGRAKLSQLQSCGCPDLDQAALRAVRDLGALPRPPADIAGRTVSVKVVFQGATTPGHLPVAPLEACG